MLTPRAWAVGAVVSGVLAATPLAVNMATSTPAAAQPDYAVALAVAARAGCMGDDVEKITIATAVGLAESDGMGDWQAVGDTTITDQTYGPSYGGWQIRSLWVDQGTGRTRDASRLLDPAFNTESMCTVSGNGTNWSPWSTFKDGSYQSRMTRAAAAAQTAMGLPVTTPGQAVSAAQQATDDGCQPARSYSFGDVLNRLWCNTVVRAWLAVRKTNPGNSTLDNVDKAVFGDPSSPAGGASGQPAAPPTLLPGSDGLDPPFAAVLARMVAAAPGPVSITSGFRTAEQQKSLGGGAPDCGYLVACVVDGVCNSQHCKGKAADLAFADDTVKAWTHDHAADYGLTYPMPWEDWHIEPDSARRAQVT